MHNGPLLQPPHFNMNASTRNRSAPAVSLVLAAALCAALAACGSKPTAPAAPPPAPAAAPEPQPLVAPVAAPAPPTAAQQQQAQKAAQGAIELLEQGNEEQARKELQQALSLDPANKLALSLMRQMSDDPVATLGKESFPYVVHSGDTLSRIAGRFMGDIYSFYILARYNGIKVPRHVAGGQTIRIPGKAPPASALTAAPGRADSRRAEPAEAAAPAAPPAAAETAFRSGEAAAKAGMLEKALGDYRRAAGLGHPSATTQADATAKRLIDIHARNARAAMARQDADGAIRSWDEVLEIDPRNETARLEKQKALRLKDKAKAPG